MTPLQQRLQQLSKFQMTLALWAGASTPHEADAAERAARRLMAVYEIDPLQLGHVSLYDGQSFADNALLLRLRDEWRAAHPNFYYGKVSEGGGASRLKRKPRPRKPKVEEPVNRFDGMFDDFITSTDAMYALLHPVLDDYAEAAEAAETAEAARSFKDYFADDDTEATKQEG